MSNFFICCYFKQALPFKKLFYSFQGPHLLGRKWFVTINLNFRIYDNLFNPWYSLIFGLIWCVCPTYLPWSTLNSLELPGGGGEAPAGELPRSYWPVSWAWTRGWTMEGASKHCSSMLHASRCRLQSVFTLTSLNGWLRHRSESQINPFLLKWLLSQKPKEWEHCFGADFVNICDKHSDCLKHVLIAE